MIHLVTAENFTQYEGLMEQAFRLRHSVFVDEMGWEELRRADGREVDQFDDGHAVHMLYVEDQKLLGYQRLLPSIRPNLLSTVLRHLCDDEPPAAADVWEWTRYCVAPGCRDRGRMLSPIGNMLLSGIVEWGIQNGVSKIIIEMNPIWLLRLVQLHFRVAPLGVPHEVGKDSVVAVTAAFDQRTLLRLRETRGDDRPMLAAMEKSGLSRAASN
ncbi:autoinducer synthase [Rhodopseudomonas sp. AAP120]|uniref:Autoinducer synthesis protein n=1 Tax=Rhodopseudomonas palustris (strain BisB5) TaxID=316057 RepID=Q138S9_RHOPS|nr:MULTISPECIES: acyl-homoserine-lactone synthase [Rhodopseudomonas]ABE39410.1 autoinducer synthesis protein [Rhodopseudomonas palustris BisB5]ACF00849.1 autoinducer synthesis protein [Rhodopseudomonas palustris TIE-1]KPG01729.1 autoinducer synthase [Rhodopseudomonas sp. AAP120]